MKWTKVEDGLPEESGLYWAYGYGEERNAYGCVCCEGGNHCSWVIPFQRKKERDKYMLVMCFSKEKETWWFREEQKPFTITHWMSTCMPEEPQD